MEWFLKVVRDNYANFNGRARRKELWMFYLFAIIFGFIVGFVDGIIGTSGLIIMIYYLALIVPTIAVIVRRLHDVGKSGWFYFVGLIPIIGGIWLLILLVSDSQSGENDYGSCPK